MSDERTPETVGERTENVKAHNLPARMFPITVTYFDALMHVIERDTITGPGVMKIKPFEDPVGVQMTFADGSTQISPVPPQDVFDAGKIGDADAYERWYETLCPQEDLVSGVGHCFKTRGHEPPCELMYFMPGGAVAKIAFDPRPIADLWIQEVSGDG